ncbi:MAG: LPS export ABC transporter periplasmic protein LptC [Candidatus Kapabacteria bacterium]|nr:LPS export ABC transporter periplasmic protein LptC [Ignavibacteriota bacterium]MCW5884477.1 LPS export ABC transporter periplasmic protein LptC [Candidatus Kapabacteria bacterium]
MIEFKHHIKYLKIVFISLFVMWILASVTSCDIFDSKIAKPVDSTYVFPEPDQSGTDIEVLFVDSGYTKAKLKAKKGRVFQDNQETFLDDMVNVDFYSRFSGARISNLIADSARIDDVTKNMLARGNVVVISDSTGNKLETQILEWNNRTQKIYSNEFVKISTRNEIITGYGFESDQNLENYKINRVSGISYRNN